MDPTDSTNNINKDCPAYFEVRHSEAALQTLRVCQVWEEGDVCPLFDACPYRHEDHDVVIDQSLVRMKRLTMMVTDTDENPESGPTPGPVEQVDDDDWDDGPNEEDPAYPGPVQLDEDWDDDSNEEVPIDFPDMAEAEVIARVIAQVYDEWENMMLNPGLYYSSSDYDDDDDFEWSLRNGPIPAPNTSTLQGQSSSTAGAAGPGQSQRNNHTTNANNGDLNRRRVKTSDCKFFFSTGGTCRKGDSCNFRHNTSALGSSVICEDWHGRRVCPLNDVCNKRHATRREVEVTNAEMNLNSTRTTRDTSNSTIHSTVDTSSSVDAEAGAGSSGVNGGSNIAGSGSGNDLNLNARRMESTVDTSNNDAEASVGAAGGGSTSTTTDHAHSHSHAHNHRNQNDCRDFIFKECPRGDACLLRHSEYLKSHRRQDIGICSDWRSPRGCNCDCRMRHYIPYDQFKLSKEEKKKKSAAAATTAAGSDTTAAGEPSDQNQNPADDDKIECKICYMEFQEIKRRGERIVSLDCGHMVCEKCCRSIMRSQLDPRCPYCRLRIRNPRPLYLN